MTIFPEFIASIRVIPKLSFFVFSAKYIDEFLKIIRYIIKDANIFVISHKTELHDKFDNCIKFDKVKGFSKIVK